MTCTLGGTTTFSNEPVNTRDYTMKYTVTNPLSFGSKVGQSAMTDSAAHADDHRWSALL